MKKTILAFCIALWSLPLLLAAQPDSLWSFALEGDRGDFPWRLAPAPDGGVFWSGVTNSRSGDFADNQRELGVWAARVSKDGHLEWINNFSNGLDEGFGIAGITSTIEGNLICLGRREFPGRQTDAWIALLGLDGQIIWEAVYGGTGSETASAVLPLKNGHYLVAGSSDSADGDKTEHFGERDIWLLELGPAGELLWQSTIGGSKSEYAQQILPHEDGFLILGHTYSDDGHVSWQRGGGDIWLVKVDARGQVLWDKSYGGSQLDLPVQLLEKSDGNYVLLATIQSTDQQIHHHHGGVTDIWLAELTPDFNIVWSRAYGGSQRDSAEGMIATASGSIIVGGVALSNDGDISSGERFGGGWMFEAGRYGEILWDIKLGSFYYNSFIYAIAPSKDEGFYISRWIGKDVQWNDAPSINAWLTKYGPPFPKLNAAEDCPVFKIFPNPSNSKNLSLRFPAAVTFDGQIALYDLLGREVARIPAYFGGLEHSFALPASLPAGAYVLELRHGGLICRQKVILQ